MGIDISETGSMLLLAIPSLGSRMDCEHQKFHYRVTNFNEQELQLNCYSYQKKKGINLTFTSAWKSVLEHPSYSNTWKTLLQARKNGLIFRQKYRNLKSTKYWSESHKSWESELLWFTVIQTWSGIPTKTSVFQQQVVISWHHPVTNSIYHMT